MASKSSGTTTATFGAAPIRSGFRASLALALTSGLGLYFYFYSHRPVPHETARLPVGESVKEFHTWTEGMRRPGSSTSASSHTAALISKDDVPPVGVPDMNTTYTPSQLMSLPILHHTFEDPFDRRNGFKPLRPSQSPWSTDTESGLLLIDRLSRSRFPSADSNDPNRGSLPPPLPPWPSPKILQEKQNSLKKPISKDLILGLNTSYVWEDEHLIQNGQLPKIQWDGFDKHNWESPPDRFDRLERQGWVRRGFQHVWEGYKARAWGHDELRPISGSFQDPFAGWGATLVDCLDTLLIMNLTLEYNYARTHVKAIDWAHTIDMSRVTRYSSHLNTQPAISFFETVIRYMGGLISAYDLSGDELMLERAEELAEWLVPAFGTASGFPPSRYQMGSNPSGEHTGPVCLAEIGSLTLEFTRLSQLTSKKFYHDVVQKIIDLLDSDQWISPSRLGTLFPTLVDPQSPQALSGQYTFGAMADSYYEYLIKQFQLLRGTNSQYSKMYTSAIESAREHLIRTYDLESSGGKNLTVIGDISWGVFKPSLDHLTCFSGAMIGLGSRLLGRKQDLDLALRYADACVWAYESTKTGVGPERISIVEGDEHTRWRPVIYQGQKFRELKSDPPPGASIEDGRYLGRPETIESVYYMWRITGDRQWQDRGWRMFTSWMEACATSFGFADLAEVNSWPPQISDKQESFVLAETFKYYYLLFSEPDLISLDEYVFNTEAHPFRLQQPSGSKGSKAEIKRYWNGSNSTLDDKYDPPGVHQNQTGFGTFLQQWSRVDLDKISDADRLVYNQVLGLLQH
ncbi:hypothetical protein Pst134EA_029210 [Puccinia striiformis f. sp. tritici]|nr:hypothetical protein Pst134EA_029210 [Puccinia striiformis f. sp. tritici]KAH9447168.1 hypothetical protein Pst134EA_029210 [Puccinia striiformis f. sp. tritici]